MFRIRGTSKGDEGENINQDKSKLVVVDTEQNSCFIEIKPMMS